MRSAYASSPGARSKPSACASSSSARIRSTHACACAGSPILLRKLRSAGAGEIRFRFSDLALERGGGLREIVGGFELVLVNRVHCGVHVFERLVQLLQLQGRL